MMRLKSDIRAIMKRNKKDLQKPKVKYNQDCAKCIHLSKASSYFYCGVDSIKEPSECGAYIPKRYKRYDKHKSKNPLN